MRDISYSLLIGFSYAVGFWIPDIAMHSFDRADIVVPIISILVSYTTIKFLPDLPAKS